MKKPPCCSSCSRCGNNEECDEFDEATTKKLTGWKIVAKAVRDKKATHAANSFNCLFYTTWRQRQEEREQEAGIEVSRRFPLSADQQVRCALKNLARTES